MRNRTSFSQWWSPLLLLSLLVAATATVLSRTCVPLGTDRNTVEVVPGHVPLETELQATLTTSPDDRTALLALADLYAHTGRLSEAIPLFQRVIAAAPADVPARLSFAQALLASGYIADATAQLHAALAVAPNHPQILFLLGQAAEQRTPPDYETARAWYEKAATGDGPYARLARERLSALPSP
ncbi:MAG: tetratricopeptide repeat protein [Thermomicrobium sp.]